MQLRSITVVFSLLAASSAMAADSEAGRAKAAVVCAACHGANGVSVADHIPNLAGQRAGYLMNQLQAFKTGSRKSDIMSAIAGQLGQEDLANLAAHFSSLPPAASGTKSAFLPNLAKTYMTFPANYKTAFTRYFTQNNPESKQVRIYYANDKAVSAAVAGKALPDGSTIVVEVYSAKLDADKKPVMGSDGFFVPDQLRGYTGMARDTGWGKDIPEMLRNEDWNYALFAADRTPRTTMNQAECLACHKPMDKSSFTFTLKELAAVRVGRQ